MLHCLPSREVWLAVESCEPPEVEVWPRVFWLMEGAQANSLLPLSGLVDTLVLDIVSVGNTPDGPAVREPVWVGKVRLVWPFIFMIVWITVGSRGNWESGMEFAEFNVFSLLVMLVMSCIMLSMLDKGGVLLPIRFAAENDVGAWVDGVDVELLKILWPFTNGGGITGGSWGNPGKSKFIGKNEGCATDPPGENWLRKNPVKDKQKIRLTVWKNPSQKVKLGKIRVI